MVSVHLTSTKMKIITHFFYSKTRFLGGFFGSNRKIIKNVCNLCKNTKKKHNTIILNTSQDAKKQTISTTSTHTNYKTNRHTKGAGYK